MARALLLSVTAILLGAALVAQQSRGGQGRGRGAAMKPGEECPPGTTLVRVGACQAPEFPPPSIVDYRPASSLVVERAPGSTGEVSRRRHPQPHRARRPATIASLIAQMDALNIRVLEQSERRIRATRSSSASTTSRARRTRTGSRCSQTG